MPERFSSGSVSTRLHRIAELARKAPEKKLRNFLDQRVRDGVIRKVIDKWLKAGVLDDGQLRRTSDGTPQGGVISPLLANIYLHEVLDRWFVEQVQPRMRGPAHLIRYADDFVIVFSEESDARRVGLPGRSSGSLSGANETGTSRSRSNTGTSPWCCWGTTRTTV